MPENYCKQLECKENLSLVWKVSETFKYFTSLNKLSYNYNSTDLKMLQLDGNNFNGKITVDFEHIQNLTCIVLSDDNFGSGELDEMNFISSVANYSNSEIL